MDFRADESPIRAVGDACQALEEVFLHLAIEFLTRLKVVIGGDTRTFWQHRVDRLPQSINEVVRFDVPTVTERDLRTLRPGKPGLAANLPTVGRSGTPAQVS